MKKDRVRFFEIFNKDPEEFEISTEVHVSRDAQGNVVSGTYNVRTLRDGMPRSQISTMFMP